MEWIKKGKIYNVNNHSEWMQDYAQVPTPVKFDSYYRIYFTTRHQPKKDALPISSIAYIDVDRNDLKHILRISNTPVLQLGKLGAFDEFGQMPADIIKIDETTHYMYYTGWSRSASVPYVTRIGLAISKDNCKSFQKLFDGPILGLNKYDPILVNGPSVIKKDDIYYMFYSSATKWIEHHGKKEVFYYIKRAISKNGIDWETNHDLCIDTLIDNEVQNAPRVSKVGDIYYMWFCYRKGVEFRGKPDNGYQLGLSISRDLEHWERISVSSLGISKSDFGWDSMMMCYPYMIKDLEKLLLFYNGNYFGKEGFGYAELNIKSLIS
ncbi:glycoside hydrolase family protein [Confluentibacter flavum]|uniref:Glycosylase n=1 Tax=Confluentibacter flavum TaxID=1909700 RepID=A0A2N3HP50_9FLAO|nr:hypothetical protein [Confluentibacter flavum]PKQ46725.1 hypothetical protein CSW08_01625 [Confluentibacter flavum]